MANDVRARMVAGAVQLLAERGLQATSFSEVLDLTKAPRGSIYHHFPEGKTQLVAAAVELAGARALATIEALRGAPPAEIAAQFLALWRALLTHSQCRFGCAVLAVTIAADSAELLDRAGGVFRSWRTHLAGLLEHGGLSRADALGLATTLIASSEGAVVLSRAERSLEPFDLVSEFLITAARALPRSPHSDAAQGPRPPAR